MQQSFAQSLSNFKFQTIGEQTEDEKMIGRRWILCDRSDVSASILQLLMHGFVGLSVDCYARPTHLVL